MNDEWQDLLLTEVCGSVQLFLAAAQVPGWQDQHISSNLQ